MTGDQGPPPAGSLAEEAAKLLGVLQGWAGETGGRPGDGHGAAGAAGAARSAAERVLADLDEHLATGGPDCTYCPLCRLIALARGTSPEVRDHLATAAGSLMQAAAGLLATRVPQPEPARGDDRGGPAVEHIDVAGDGSAEDAQDWREDWEDD